MLYEVPRLDQEDHAVLDEISAMRAQMAWVIRDPAPWTARLRRTALARAIQGSTAIAGYSVGLDDADAALDNEDSLSAAPREYAEVRGYRRALAYALAMAQDSNSPIDASTLRSMHFIMLGHDATQRPGQYRTDDEPGIDGAHRGRITYIGPEPADLPILMRELVDEVTSSTRDDPLVRAAMAHLNLALIRPFRDGNGRVARALQTMVLAHSGLAEPMFASIEEWLGGHADDYRRVLEVTGRGAWDPDGDAHLWLQFVLRAHHLQAQTLRRRWRQAEHSYLLLEEAARAHRLPPRTIDPLWTALLGFRLRRSTYVGQAQLDPRTASRDFRAMTDAGLLTPVGETTSRNYIRGQALEVIRRTVERDEPMVDPYPGMASALGRGAVS